MPVLAEETGNVPPSCQGGRMERAPAEDGMPSLSSNKPAFHETMLNLTMHQAPAEPRGVVSPCWGRPPSRAILANDGLAFLAAIA
jgi:hypothetical protein